jgi:hypothetical protein
MARLLRLTRVVALFLAAPALLAIMPRPAQAACVDLGCSDVNVREYVNEGSGHYLLLPAGDPEVAVVEGGGAGPGWQRTYNDFTTNTMAPWPVCRFYSPVFGTHFYTASSSECELVKHNPDWVYEKSPFDANLTSSGSCGSLTPVYRLYHGGDHRYTVDMAIRSEMLANGWADEGIAFCVESGGREVVKTLSADPTRIDSAHACQATAGDCVALDSLAPMPNRVPPWIPPGYTQNPAYPFAAGAVAGIYLGGLGDIYTSQPADAAAILQHSFASLPYGMYINGHERTGGDYASISPMVELPGVAGSSSDERIFLWRTNTDGQLRVNAYVYVGLVAQDGPGSHAYGGLQLQFGDARSGHSFLATVQAYGTVPPGDFVAPDARTGEPIVSTVFRPDPMFGSVQYGAFVACLSGNYCAPHPSAPGIGQRDPFFEFTLGHADFRTALNRARTVDPSLSPDPADYFLARVEFKNETYLDARLGATILDLTAQIRYVE